MQTSGEVLYKKSRKILIDLTYILNVKDLNKSTSIYLQRFLDNIDTMVYSEYQFIFLVREGVFDYFSEKYNGLGIQFITFDECKNISISFLKSIIDSKHWQRQVNAIDCDVVYVPFTWIYSSRRINKKKIITIHDLKPIHEVAGKYNKRGKIIKHIMLALYRHYFSKSAKTADAIITISEYVKAQIEKELSFKCPVYCVYNGVPVSDEYQKIDALENTRFILYVNTLTEYKNVATLIKAFSLVNDSELALVIVGKETDYWKSVCVPFIRNEKIVRLQYVEDAELNWLYKNAALFVTTSTKEGFGYTPIEAALRKTPVISTRCEALPEVTLGMATYYDNPYDEKQLAEKIKEVLCSMNSEEYNENLNKIYRSFSEKYDIKQNSQAILRILTESEQ